jgi:hypothetical protein
MDAEDGFAAVAESCRRKQNVATITPGVTVPERIAWFSPAIFGGGIRKLGEMGGKSAHPRQAPPAGGGNGNGC